MGQELYWTYAFNLIVNSVLSFFTTIVLVEVFMRLLRIKHPRIKGLCCFVPFCKIGLDLFLYQFSNWALLHGTNPLLAETGTRQLSIMVSPFTGIRFSMQDGKTFSLADVMALSIDPLWVRLIVILAIGGSVIACGLHLVRLARGRRRVDQIMQSATPIDTLPLNPSLRSWVEKKQIRLAATPAVDTPCIAGKTIIFPLRLIDDLTQEEREAVVAHEAAHYHWKDSSLRLTILTIAAIFWWIPAKVWQRRMEKMQEQACDSMIHRFGISRFALAGAVLKTAQKTRGMPLHVFCFADRRSSFKDRMRMIVQEPVRQALGWKAIQYGLLAIGLLSILFGRLWIF